MIRPISPEMLREDLLQTVFYPDLEHTLYWSQDWDPAFYVALARAGFISISYEHPDYGPLLIAELQPAYAVLDWPNLHVSQRVQKLMRSGRLEEEGVELRIVDDCQRVLDLVVAYHQPESWLTLPYRALLPRLPAEGDPRFSLRGVELWSTERDEPIAGELGYTIGRTYTSLTGFCTRPDRAWRHFGTLQMVLLAEKLRACGYAFWNMGHPQQGYKRALGAHVVPRLEFLDRWQTARDLMAAEPLA